MINNPYAAYGLSHTRALKGRNLEAEAFLAAARLLEQARLYPKNRRTLAKALNFNTKLWSIIQADLSNAHHQLDAKLKANVLSLSLFMDRAAMTLLQRHDSHTLQAMIDINRDFAKTLLG